MGSYSCRRDGNAIDGNRRSSDLFRRGEKPRHSVNGGQAFKEIPSI